MSIHRLFQILLLTTLFSLFTSPINASVYPTGIKQSNITRDNANHLYTTSWADNKIRKFDFRGRLLEEYTLPISSNNMTTGILVNRQKDIFVIISSMDKQQSAHGIWKISHRGNISKFADLELGSLPSDLTSDLYGNLYVSESKFGKIYKVNPEGHVSNWLTDKLLQGNRKRLGNTLLGTNGITFKESSSFFGLKKSQQSLYISNGDKGMILKVNIKTDGSAAHAIDVFAHNILLKGIDGLRFNHFGQLYAAIQSTHKIVQVSKTGSISKIQTNHNLDFPGDVIFNTQRISTPYMANAALLHSAIPSTLSITAQTSAKQQTKLLVTNESPLK